MGGTSHFRNRILDTNGELVILVLRVTAMYGGDLRLKAGLFTLLATQVIAETAFIGPRIAHAKSKHRDCRSCS